MKTRIGICLICALGMLCACAAPAEEDASAAKGSVREASVSSVSGLDEVGEIRKSGAQYIFLEGSLVGTWEEGNWHSAEKEKDTSLGSPLEANTYYTYSAEQYLGAVQEVTIEMPQSEGKTQELLALPAKEEQGTDWETCKASFGGENCVLAVSREENCLPSVVQWKCGEAVSQEDLAAVQQIVAREGLDQKLEVQTAVVDFDGDGKQETYIFVNTAATGQEESASRALLVFLREEDSRVETVYARFLPTGEQNLTFSLTPMGIYDLNGDGGEEICLRVQEGESVSHLVVSHTGEQWEIVLRSEEEAPLS